MVWCSCGTCCKSWQQQADLHKPICPYCNDVAMLEDIKAPAQTALFTELASATLKRCEQTFTERGEQYGDTWRNCRWYAVKAVAQKLGITLNDQQARCIGLAVFVDMKYERMGGGWNEDHLRDGINYQAALSSEMNNLATGAQTA